MVSIPNGHAPHKRLYSSQITYHSVIGVANTKILLKISHIVIHVKRMEENVRTVIDHYLKNFTAVMLIFAMPAPPNGIII